jgi:hypothetical protein
MRTQELTGEWLSDFGGDMKIYRGLILRTGNQSFYGCVMTLQGHIIGYIQCIEEIYYRTGYGRKGLQRNIETLADDILQGETFSPVAFSHINELNNPYIKQDESETYVGPLERHSQRLRTWHTYGN